MILAESEDGLLLATVHVYSPAVVTVSLGSLGDSVGVSGPSDSGSRSTSGDADEGELIRVKI